MNSVPDGVDSVAKAVVEMSDKEDCELADHRRHWSSPPRDVTPKRTRTIIRRELAGSGELVRRASVEHVPTPILSRQTAGKAPNRQSAGAALVIDVCLDAGSPAMSSEPLPLGEP
jgi:molybdopterin adenylyltransferase